MPVRTIVKWPSPKLSETADPISELGEATVSLARDLYDTMVVNHGAGLAATQVGVAKAMCVIKSDLQVNSVLPADPVTPNAIVLVNPKIEFLGSEKFQWREACLSVDDIEEEVVRHKSIKLQYTDLEDTAHEFILHDHLAGVVQHETDHLVGKVFIDRLTADRKRKVRSQFQSKKRAETARLRKILKLKKREAAIERAQNSEVPRSGFRSASKNKSKVQAKRKKSAKTFGKTKRKKK